MRRSALRPTEFHIALIALVISIAINSVGVAYYVTQERKSSQTLYELTEVTHKLKLAAQAPPVRSADDLKYQIQTLRAVERLEKLVTDLKEDHSTFRKVVEPKLEKLEQRRR